MKYLNKFLCIFNNFFLIPLIISLCYHFLYAFCNDCIFEIIPSNMFVTVLIIDSLYLIWLGIIGRDNISYCILLLLLFLLFVINQIKIIYSGNPLFLSDFEFADSPSNLIDIVGDDFLIKISSVFGYFAILFLICICILFYQRFFKLKLPSFKSRCVCSLLGVFFLFMLFYPFSWSNKFYKDLFFDVDSYNDYYSYTSYVSLYSYYGIIGGMYYNVLDNRLEVPEGFDDEKLNVLLDNVNEVKGSIGRPNIIVVLSESFFDINLLSDNIVFDKEITSNFNLLKNDGYLLEGISPSYGGMTANVTFELLTGGNMSYFGRGYIPFMQLYNEDRIKTSIVKDFADNGYYTEIFLGNDSYDSEELMLNLGFSKYNEVKKTEDNVKGEWVSDDYMADLIINSMNSIEGKKFIMVETMQSHMNYSPFKYNSYDIKVDSSNLDKKYNDVLLSYAQGIYDADKMLKKLYDYIQTIEEETVLIFFGDHLPYLGCHDGINVIDKLSYFNTDNEILNLYRLYNTESLVLSNYDLKLNFDKRDYLGFDLLLSSLISQMDIENSSYYNWLYSTKDILPSYNRYIAVDKMGNIYKINNLDNRMKDIYELRNLMMYKMIIKES